MCGKTICDRIRNVNTRERVGERIGDYEMDQNIVYDKTLWRNLIHVADLT
jgi:hypothetical protein